MFPFKCILKSSSCFTLNLEYGYPVHEHCQRQVYIVTSTSNKTSDFHNYTGAFKILTVVYLYLYDDVLMNQPFSQDTCTGFLLGGIGELNKKREPNFLVVDKSKYDND